MVNLITKAKYFFYIFYVNLKIRPSELDHIDLKPGLYISEARFLSGSIFFLLFIVHKVYYRYKNIVVRILPLISTQY